MGICASTNKRKSSDFHSRIQQGFGNSRNTLETLRKRQPTEYDPKKPFEYQYNVRIGNVVMDVLAPMEPFDLSVGEVPKEIP